jgi:nucleotide-binding universal stress UspA family protein
MCYPDSPGPVVVGIDGSRAAIGAAQWAVDEAVSRDVALRLVYVIHMAGASPDTTDEDFRVEVVYAELALRAAHLAVETSGQPVKVETAVLRGDLVNVLVEESSAATMMCVGSAGIGWVARRVLGSTAAALASRAHCPVAIIRSDTDTALADTGWVAVVVDDEPDNEAVLHRAYAEAELRDAGILALSVWPSGLGEIPYDALDRRLGVWVGCYPEVHVQPVAVRSGIPHYLATHDDPVELLVVGSAHAGQVPRIIGPHRHPVLPHPGCSVLVVRR